MRKLILLLLITCNGYAQNPTALFNESVTEKADAVIQEESYQITFSQEKQTLVHKATITILNKAADELGNLTVYYDKDSKINRLKMNFFDAYGKEIKKVKRKDFNDYSATGNSNLYTDNRVLHYEYIAKNYPYTVQYEYEISSKNTAFIQPWHPIIGYNIAVIKSQYSIRNSPEVTLHKIEKNIDSFNISKKSITGGMSYTLEHAPALEKEPFSPSFENLVPVVRFASNKFQLAGVKGQANNWQEFGKWIYDKLLVTRNNLSEETKTQIKQLVKGVEDPIERARLIYDYVQQKTRYISVQIGIGGWMPMLTDDVDKLAYGDCKALTYYTKSLLDIAAVPSYYTIVYAGDAKQNIAKDLVAVQGNHAFLCLPTAKDTIWLECTSQKVPFAYVNSFTDDRDVLVITENGGEIKHTSKNKATDNLQKTKMTYLITTDGKITGDADIKSYGTQYKNHLNNFEGLSPKDLLTQFKEYYDVNAIQFSDIEVKNNKKARSFDESFHFTASSYAKKYTANSLVFYLNPFNKIGYIPKRIKNRKQDLVINRGYNDVDDYTIKLPEGYHLKSLPDDISLETAFGNYERKITQEANNQLHFYRSFTLKSGTFPKESYTKYRDFRKKIAHLENLKIMITK